uniref:Uncharacterized protein n=1 Tax=Anguilla anguilla TaxID=7936 RepID=A0A0E9R9X0_ANGAN
MFPINIAKNRSRAGLRPPRSNYWQNGTARQHKCGLCFALCSALPDDSLRRVQPEVIICFTYSCKYLHDNGGNRRQCFRV